MPGWSEGSKYSLGTAVVQPVWGMVVSSPVLSGSISGSDGANCREQPTRTVSKRAAVSKIKIVSLKVPSPFVDFSCQVSLPPRTDSGRR